MYLEVFEKTSQEVLNFQIAPDETKVIKTITLLKTKFEAGNPSLIYSSFVLTNMIGDTCTKDYVNPDEWTIYTNSTSPPAKTHVNYTYTVSDDDF